MIYKLKIINKVQYNNAENKKNKPLVYLVLVYGYHVNRDVEPRVSRLQPISSTSLA